jgi:hypothetical protein
MKHAHPTEVPPLFRAAETGMNEPVLTGLGHTDRAHTEYDTALALSVPPRDPNIAPFDVPRATSQNERILERLREGPATNAELVRISLNFTGRISDLRAAGHTIQPDARFKGDGGVVTYRLLGDAGVGA